MLITLASVEKMFAGNSRHCVLMIDSISVWYNSAEASDNRRLFASVVGKLKDMIDTYKLVTFVSKSALFTRDCFYSDSKLMTSQSVMLLRHNEYLGNVWSSFVTHRLIFLLRNKLGQKLFWIMKEHGFENQSCQEFIITDEGLKFQKSPIQ